MRAAIDTFRAGLNDLTGFLRNAEHESALASMLLSETRFGSLTAPEQALLGEISKASTSKRQYLYAVAVVGLYGLLERFIDRVLAAYVDELCETVTTYEQLPEAIRKNHLPASIELLKAMNEERYRGNVQISDVIANLHSCMTPSDGFRINGSAFVLHRGNVKLEKIRTFLTGLGLDAKTRRLLVMPSLEHFFADADPPRDVHNLPDQDLDFLVLPIDDLVDRRNEIAHGVVDNIESVDLLLVRSAFLSAFVDALHERLRMELLPYKLVGKGVQELGMPIATFGGRVACFERASGQVVRGDPVVAATGDSLVPYRWGEVLGLQVDRIDYPALQISQMTQFGVKVSFKVKDTYRFYLLKALPS